MDSNSAPPNEYSNVQFNGQGLMPKLPTQALAFLKQNQNFDGRNIVVAVFDTGVDPGAEGLQKTPSGLPKIIDCIDGTGSGDVDTSTVKKADDGTLIGLTGRKLKLGPWSPPESCEYHLGMKNGYDLMPSSLSKRLSSEKKTKFEKLHRETLDSLCKQQSEINQALSSLSSSPSTGKEASEKNDSSSSQPTEKEAMEKLKTKKEDLDTQVEKLNLLMNNYVDPSPIFDILCWKDPQDGQFRVVVDTTETGDLTQLKPLKPYHLNQEYSCISDESRMNFSVNVWDDGNLVEIVTTAGSHGSHVAGIIGAYYGDGNDYNGVAPGCQIISVKIGDTRLETMETGVGLVRGLTAARRHKVDIINMSYGEPSSLCNQGIVSDLLNDLIHKHGVIFVGSAGNSGPCLSTTGSPSSTTHGCISVAATVNSDMMEQLYSMRELTDDKPYSWSSRGPSIDGGMGVTINAPGGAIAAVPTWTLRKNVLMNGTSMSSPNAAGCVALVLSGLKQSEISYSPSSVRLAIQNTAKFVPNELRSSQGFGTIQVSSAFEYLKTHHSKWNSNCRLEVKVGTRNNGRGIYIRNENDFSSNEVEDSITVEPVWHENTPNDQKISFEIQIEIKTDAPDWVQVPKFVALSNVDKTFKVLIRPPAALNEEKGSVFEAKIYGVSIDHPELGSLFTVPITVVSPATSRKQKYSFSNNSGQLTPGTLYRHYYNVPSDANWMTVTLDSDNFPHSRTIVVSALQLLPDSSHKNNLLDKYVQMKGTESKTLSIPVTPGFTVEVVVGQFWSSLGSQGKFSYSIAFNGVLHDDSVNLTFYGELSQISLTNGIGTNKISPKPALYSFSRTLTPSFCSGILPLYKGRDSLETGTTYQLILGYSYWTDEANIKILPRLSGWSKLLYESPMESQMFMIFDSNKNRIGVTDFNPSWITLPEKGAYTLRLSIRSATISFLEKFKTASIQLERLLPKDKVISLNVYTSLVAGLTAGKKFPPDGTNYVTHPTFPIYIQAPSSNQIPSYVKAGDVLLGVMPLVKQDTESMTDDHGFDPRLFATASVKFVVPHKSTPAASSDSIEPSSSPSTGDGGAAASAGNSNSATPAAAMRNTILAAVHSHLNALNATTDGFAKFKESVDEAVKMIPGYENEQKSKFIFIQHLQKHHKAAPDDDKMNALIKACDDLIATINVTSLAVYFGTRHPNETPQERQNMEEIRNWLIGSLSAKLYALSKDQNSNEYMAVHKELSAWADPDAPVLPEGAPSISGDKKGSKKSKKAIASAPGALSTPTGPNDKPAKPTLQEMLDIAKKYAWAHWVAHLELCLLAKTNPKFQLF